MLSLEKSHETEIECPYCKKIIGKELIFDGRCPICRRQLKKKCVICGKDFFKREIGNPRQCCYSEDCLKKFRYFCGIGNRFWRTEEEKKQAEKRRENQKMPRKKRSLVLEVCLSDRESFPNLPTKKQQKNIYDRVRNKLIRYGLEGEMLKTKMVTEIQSELFKLQPEFKPKSEIKEDNEADFFDRKTFRIRGVRIWGDNQESTDPLKKELEIWEKNTERYMGQFCPVCKTNPCKCHKEGDE